MVLKSGFLTFALNCGVMQVMQLTMLARFHFVFHGEKGVLYKLFTISQIWLFLHSVRVTLHPSNRSFNKLLGWENSYNMDFWGWFCIEIYRFIFFHNFLFTQINQTHFWYLLLNLNKLKKISRDTNNEQSII